MALSSRHLSRLTAVVAGIAAVVLTGPATVHASVTPAAGATLPKPAAAGPGDAPIGGVIPGRTGTAVHASAQTQAAHRKSSLARVAGAAAQEHPAIGTYFVNLTRSTGVRAAHSVFYGTGDRTVRDDVVYSPTLMPPSNACIEITTAYTYNQPVVWAWDWCARNSGVAKEIPIDANFVATYTTQRNGLPAYDIDIEKTDAGRNTWTAYLYNWRNGQWDVFWSKSGTSQIGADGWDVFEAYLTRDPSTGLGYYCGSMRGRRFEAAGLQVLINGTYQDAAPSNNAEYYRLDMGCGSRLSWTQPNLANWSGTIN